MAFIKSHSFWYLVSPDDGVRGQAAPIADDDGVHSAQKYMKQYEKRAIEVSEQTSRFL